MTRNDDLLNDLPAQRTIRLVLLSLLTLGVYAAHYMKQQSLTLNRYGAPRETVPHWFLNAVLLLAYVSAALDVAYVIVETGHPVERISDCLDTFFALACVIWGFVVRKRMNGMLQASRGDTAWFSCFWTLLFTPFYFNYKVNVLRSTSPAGRPPLVV